MIHRLQAKNVDRAFELFVMINPIPRRLNLPVNSYCIFRTIANPIATECLRNRFGHMHRPATVSRNRCA